MIETSSGPVQVVAGLPTQVSVPDSRSGGTS